VIKAVEGLPGRFRATQVRLVRGYRNLGSAPRSGDQCCGAENDTDSNSALVASNVPPKRAQKVAGVVWAATTGIAGLEGKPRPSSPLKPAGDQALWNAPHGVLVRVRDECRAAGGGSAQQPGRSSKPAESQREQVIIVRGPGALAQIVPSGPRGPRPTTWTMLQDHDRNYAK
jgi:hypothetical protein